MAARKSLVVTRSLRSATIWGAETAEPVATIPLSTGLPLVAISPTRSEIALGTERAVELLDFDGRLLRRLELNSRVLAFAFSPDGRRLAVGDADEKLSMFEVS
jgi:WD40 repeat protein